MAGRLSDPAADGLQGGERMGSLIGRWISVHERLPEIDKPVLWYYPSGNMNVWSLDKDEEFGRPSVYGNAVWPTHWMELPESPK